MTGRTRGRGGLRFGPLLIVAVAAVAVGGCALVPTPWVGGWELRTVDGQPAAAKATVVFTATDVVFETGCNQGAGKYAAADGKLTFTEVAFTAVGCSGAIGAQDAAMVALAGETPAFSAADDRLIIDPGGGRPVLVFDRTSGA